MNELRIGSQSQLHQVDFAPQPPVLVANNHFPEIHKPLSQVISELVTPMWTPIQWVTGLTVVQAAGRVARPVFNLLFENTPIGDVRGHVENLPDTLKDVRKKGAQVLGTMLITAPSLVLLGIISNVGGQIASPLGWGRMIVSDTWSGIAWSSIGISLYTHFKPLRPHIFWGGVGLYAINNYTPFAGFVPAPWDIFTGNSGVLNLTTGTIKFVWNIPTQVKAWTATVLVGGAVFFGVKKVFNGAKAVVGVFMPILRTGWHLVRPGDGLS